MKKDTSIQIIRVFSMTMIVICHLLSIMQNYYMIALSQFFSIGVYIFLFISGFLYGKKEIKNYKKWYIGRVKKILIPVWLFSFSVLLYCIFFNKNKFDISYIFIYLFNIQGFFKGFIGLGHLWFLTPLMICYLLLFVIKKGKNNKTPLLFVIFLLILSIVTCFINKTFSLYCFYIITFYLGYIYRGFYKKNISKRNFCVSVFTIVLFSIIRLLTNSFFDNSVIYNSFCVPLTSIFISIGMFSLICNITNKLSNNKYIDFFDELSLYIYITHYSFFIGPFITLNQHNIIPNFLLSLILSMISAILLKKIHEMTMKFFIKEDKHYENN